MDTFTIQFESWIEKLANAGIAKIASSDPQEVVLLQKAADAAIEITLYNAQKYGVSVLMAEIAKTHPSLAGMIQEAVNVGGLVVPGLLPVPVINVAPAAPAAPKAPVAAV